MTASFAFFEVIHRLLNDVQTANAAALDQAAELVAESLAHDGLLHTFGTGHSHLIAEELFDRAGGLIPVNPLLDAGLMLHVSAMSSTAFERMHGYAEVVLKRYRLAPQDVMLVASNSGRNAVPVEMAMLARERGLKVIAMTALAYSQTQPSRHSSGKKLYELADVVLDTCGVPGDAVMRVEGVTPAVASTSTVIGAALAQALVHNVVEKLAARGLTPPLLTSANLGAGEGYGVANYARYRDRVRHL
jgi:uncharacterized phosphosugar-binding protein